MATNPNETSDEPPKPIHDAAAFILVVLHDFCGESPWRPHADMEEIVRRIEEVAVEGWHADFRLATQPAARRLVGQILPLQLLANLRRLGAAIYNCVLLLRQVRPLYGWTSPAAASMHALGARYSWHRCQHAVQNLNYPALLAATRPYRVSIPAPMPTFEAGFDWLHEQFCGMLSQARVASGQFQQIVDRTRQAWFEEADRQFNPEDHERFAAQCTTWIQGRQMYWSPPPLHGLNELQQRLVRDNLKRRNRILYIQRQEKAEYGVYKQEQLMAFRMGRDLPPPPGAHHAYCFPSPRRTTTTTATTSPCDDIMDPTTKVFSCPVCLDDTTELSTLNGGWTDHVEQDLCPYTCLIPERTNPDCLKVTSESPVEHMLRYHQAFIPFYRCPKINSNHCTPLCHGANRFYDPIEFREHLDEQMRHVEDPSQRVTVEDCRVLGEEGFGGSCPFCAGPADDVRPRDPRWLLEHIKIEQQYFALMALPWATEALMEDGAFEDWCAWMYPEPLYHIGGWPCSRKTLRTSWKVVIK
ncbi:uncharacterized protein BP01DRAFT_407318 [Aspergillus saccharolyticus JOP 1030-1]|uniref:Uncharacterized protein n=1 Tax=Aspergillus saccharolyticus JOP 1030-1 TaxID=1450539 RepID=A0A318Z2S3_9EURO|nr:hypothetical protein BP01DRAFT_407318 [Aspergillus saccharolyticus JOP 1030-1]PYH41299.1 hypothetical protein BP01DRAFT_407318 [Aspergillus saccharolyticus JOP 1030-1]